MAEEVTVVDSDGPQLMSAEFKDGQLQIVEVTPYEKEKGNHIVPDNVPSSSSENQVTKYVQVLEPGKGLVQLDLLNLTLVRCEDYEDSYRLVANTESDGGAEIPSDATVTCVLQSSDGEEVDGQESYVMMEGDQGPVVFLQSSSTQEENIVENYTKKLKKVKSQMTPAEILERAKSLQKAKELMNAASTSVQTRVGKRGRRRKGDIPSPHELLSSPNFKLFLYSCKMCSFKCNAVKELTAHKSSEHGGCTKFRGGGARTTNMLQCARCPFRARVHSQLMKHVQETHLQDKQDSEPTKISLDSKEVEEADILVCGACGFESVCKQTFRKHIVVEHGAITS